LLTGGSSGGGGNMWDLLRQQRLDQKDNERSWMLNELVSMI